MILVSAAAQIAQLAYTYCSASICVYNMDGMLLASEPKQINAGCSHEAIDCIRSGRQIIIDEKLCNYKKDLRPGVLIPVNCNGITVFAVGLYGELEKIKPNLQLISVFLTYSAKSIFIENQSLQLFESREFLVHSLINTKADQETLKRYAFITGYRLDGARICIVASPVSKKDGFSEAERLKVYRFLEEVQPDINLLLASFVDNSRLVILIPAEDGINGNEKPLILRLYGKLDKFMLDYFKTALRFSVSCLSKEAFKSCAQCYTQAERVDSLKIAVQDSISYYDEQGLQMILSYVPEDACSAYCQNVSTLMNDLNDSFDQALLETLRVFFRNNLNISETSRSLFLHRNTLLYRLQKIEDITGKNPRHYQDAVELYIMLLLSNKNIALQKAETIFEKKKISK